MKLARLVSVLCASRPVPGGSKQENGSQARALMGMPVQWKPCGKSTRFPVSRWYAHANSSCIVQARRGQLLQVAAWNCNITSHHDWQTAYSDVRQSPSTQALVNHTSGIAVRRAVTHLGQREGVAEVEQAVHVRVREGPKELVLR